MEIESALKSVLDDIDGEKQCPAHRAKLNSIADQVTELTLELAKPITAASTEELDRQRQQAIRRRPDATTIAADKQIGNIRKELQQMLGEAELMLLHIRRAMANVIEQECKDDNSYNLSDFDKNKSRVKTKTLIFSYNKLIAEIKETVLELQQKATAWDGEIHKFRHDKPKQSDKINAQFDVQPDSIAQWAATIEVDKLIPIPLPEDSNAVEREASAQIAEILSKESHYDQILGEDGSAEQCSRCRHDRDEVETLICCSNCPRAYHADCCDASPGDNEKWTCKTCNQLAELAGVWVFSAHGLVVESAEEVWAVWLKAVAPRLADRKKAVIRTAQRVVRFATVHMRTARLMMYVKNDMASWYRSIGKKDLGVLNPVMTGPDGVLLRTPAERDEATALYNENFAKVRGEPMPCMEKYIDDSGRPSFRWRECEASFEAEVQRLLQMHRDRVRDPSVTPAEVEEKVKAFEKAYRKMREWKPGSHALDWNTDWMGNKLPPGWLRNRIRDDEWETVLNGPISKKRVHGWLVPAVKWLGPTVQRVAMLIVELMVSHAMTAERFKRYLRIAIEKAIRGTYRHIAAADDWFAVSANLKYKRLLPGRLELGD